MERSSFFDAILDIEGNPDRSYLAEDIARFFGSLIGNGIFPNPSTNLQIVANNDMTITVKKGMAWINGYFYENTDDLIIQLNVADGVLNRVDRIALRLDFLDREIRAVVKQGNFGSNAVAPELQRDADAYELALADIAVNRGIISITQADVTDLRLNKELCGIVHGVVDQVDPTAIFNQFESWYAQTKANYDADIARWTQEKKDAFDEWYTTNINEFESRFNNWFRDNTTTWSNEFNTWFDNIKGQLEGDIAANLASQVTELQNTKADKTELASVDTKVSEHLVEKATETGYGHIRLQDIPTPEVATRAESEIGANNTKMMTPLRTKEAIEELASVVTSQIFTSNGVFVVPNKVERVYVTACGGGGGGSGGRDGYGGGAGGGGACIIRNIYTVSAGQTINVTVGMGGNGGKGGWGSSGATSGTTGGSTSLSGIVTLAGGRGGVRPSSSSGLNGVSGGAGGGAGYEDGIGGRRGEGSFDNFGGGGSYGGGGGGGGIARYGGPEPAGKGGAPIGNTYSNGGSGQNGFPHSGRYGGAGGNGAYGAGGGAGGAGSMEGSGTDGGNGGNGGNGIVIIEW